MGLNPEQSRKFVELVRDYLLLQAEVRSLASILLAAEKANIAPVGWLEDLKVLRQTPEYRSIAEQSEPLFARILAAADEKEVDQLLQSTPKARIPN
jgi:hypothetical protein